MSIPDRPTPIPTPEERAARVAATIGMIALAPPILVGVVSLDVAFTMGVLTGTAFLFVPIFAYIGLQWLLWRAFCPDLLIEASAELRQE